MGVLACDRAGCDNIMCDRYSSKYGYICHACFQELVDLGSRANIQQFMDTPKPDEDEDESREDPYKKYDRIFPDRWKDNADNR